MEQTAIPLGDAMSLMCNNNNNGYNAMWQNPFMYLVWMSMFNNGGFGGFGNNAGVNMATIEAAKADIVQNTQSVNDAQTLSQQVRGISNGLSEGLSSLGYSLNNSIRDNGFAINNAVKDNGYALNNSIKDNAIGISNAVNALGSTIQMGFCNTNHNIDNLKYENAKNTCEIITNATANTQRILDGICSLKMDNKDAQIADLRQQLSASQLAFSQQAQNAYLISQLKTTA